MGDRWQQRGRTAEWRRDPRPDEADMAIDSATVGDLHPEDHSASRLHLEKDARTAYDVKDVHARLRNLTDATLKQIPVLPEGTQLTPGATYLDLEAPDQGEIVPTVGMRAGRGNRYVAKADVDYQTWNVLLGVDNPERTGEADDA